MQELLLNEKNNLNKRMMEELEEKLQNFDHDAEEWTDQLGEQSNLLK